jgi:SAM-dependent methyltransferase
MSLKAFVKSHAKLMRAALWLMRMAAPFRTSLFSAIPRYSGFLLDWSRFRRAGGKAKVADFYPCLFDRTAATQFDPHYFYQAVWAMKNVMAHGTRSHVDVGSDVRFVGMLSVVTEVTFIDIRPLEVVLDNLSSRKGSILSLPYDDGAVSSLSSLHVIEHIGLGRYGDPIDPDGARKAARELVRVLAPGGRLYVSAPIGRSRVQFNGHRVFGPQEIVGLFDGLALVDMAMVDGWGTYSPHVDPAAANVAHDGGWDYCLGMCIFEKMPHAHAG